MRNKLQKTTYMKLVSELELKDHQRMQIINVWLNYLIYLNKAANRDWFSHNYSQVAVIIISLSIPILENVRTDMHSFHIGFNISWITVLSFTVALLTSLNRLFGFEKKWTHYRLNSELVRNEGDDFFALAGKYKQFLTHQDAFSFFIGNITDFKRDETRSYIEEIDKE